MEHIQNITYPQEAVYASPLRLSPYVRFVLILLSGFALAAIGAQKLALTTVVLPNPFAPYIDIFPGQPASALETRAFSCPNDHTYYEAPSRLYCSFTSEDGDFSYVGVLILGNIIQQISFITRENLFTIGDLEMIFGTRATHKLPHLAYFALPKQGNFALVNTSGKEGRFSVFLRIRSVSFTGTGLPIIKPTFSQD